MFPRQITGPSINRPPCLLESAFAPAGGAIFYSSFRTVTRQILTAGFPDGLHKQLTRAEAIYPYSAAIRDTVYDPRYTRLHPAFSRYEEHIDFTGRPTGFHQIYAVPA